MSSPRAYRKGVVDRHISDIHSYPLSTPLARGTSSAYLLPGYHRNTAGLFGAHGKMQPIQMYPSAVSYDPPRGCAMMIASRSRITLIKPLRFPLTLIFQLQHSNASMRGIRVSPPESVVGGYFLMQKNVRDVHITIRRDRFGGLAECSSLCIPLRDAGASK